MIPRSVLETAASEMLNFNGSGVSVMELSHRSKEFEGVRKDAEFDLRRIMGVPDNYKVRCFCCVDASLDC